MPSSSFLLFSIFVILVNAIHPLQKPDALRAFTPPVPIRHNALETEFLEVSKLDMVLSLNNLKDVNTRGAAITALKAEVGKQQRKITAYEALVTAPVPKYITTEDGSLPSIYLETAGHEWYRLRLQHKGGPVITEPNYVESYCAKSKASLTALRAKINDGTLKTGGEIATYVSTHPDAVNDFKLGYDGEGYNHLEVFYVGVPGAGVDVEGKPHMSGGTIRTITIHGGDLQYAKNKPGGIAVNPTITINVADSIALIKGFWSDVKKLVDELEDGGPSDDMPGIIDHLSQYCSRVAAAPQTYVSNFH